MIDLQYKMKIKIMRENKMQLGKGTISNATGTFTCGTCLGALLVCIAVCAVTDDLPISDETGSAAEGGV